MILRKRTTQITFLHVFHHASMLAIWWVVMTWIPSGQAWFGPVLNSAVHVVMYTYYGLSALPSLRDKLWWKKYITMFQLFQFMIIFVHTAQGIFTGCEFPLWGQCMLGGYMVIMLILFANYFFHEYITRANDAKRHKQKLSVANGGKIKNKYNVRSLPTVFNTDDYSSCSIIGENGIISNKKYE